MSAYNIRLGSQLSFDDEQEKDIIVAIEQLNATHKTGQFVSHLLRLALENPDILEVKNGKCEKGAIMRQMDAAGMSYDRKKFFNEVTKEVTEMKKKIDSIYDIAMQTYTLALMDKHLGLEEKSDNTLQASFILERQLKSLQDSLGVILSDPIYSSNKKDLAHEKAEDALQYIIEAYSGIVKELQVQVQPQQVVQQSSPVVQNNDVINYKPEPVKVGKTEDTPEDDEIVDFGNADMSALSTFFSD